MDQPFSGLPKWVIVIILLFILALPLVILGSQFAKPEIITPLILKTPMKSMVPQKNLSEVKFSFISQIPGYTIPEDSVDVTTLSYALDKIGLNPPVNKPFLARSLSEGDKYISPKHITITFRPVDNWELDNKLDPSLQTRIILKSKMPQGYAYIFLVGELNADESSLTIPIYINVQEFVNNQSHSLSEFFSYYALVSLYYNFHLGPLTYETNLVNAVLKLLGTPTLELFTIAKTATWFPFHLPPIHLIPQVYAGACSSGFSAGSCGNYETPVGYCFGAGSPYDGTPCADDYGCPFPAECIITGGTGSCIPSGTAGNCNNCVSGTVHYLEFTCGAGCIVSYGSCGGAVTSTPTPSPTPVPICTVGSWASCGTNGCAACDSPQCNGDGSAWNCNPNPAGCCPASPSCGDGTCNNGETCGSCPADCWCPPTPSPTPTPLAGGAWYQTVGGEIYAKESLQSLIPSGVTPRVLVQDGSGGFPGVVTHGSMVPFPGYDFDGYWGSYGEDLVSSKNWLAFEPRDDQQFFEMFKKRFGGPSTPTAGFDQVNGTKPASGVYYIVGNTSINSAWTINDGESIVLLIDGSLTINAPIQLAGTGSGFVAFITNTGITVGPTVGIASTSTTSVLDGVYITSGTLTTGVGNAGVERLNGRGMFIANNMTFQRDLGVADNALYPAQQFIYYPRFLITMPDKMKDLPTFWQEVAP